MFSVYLIPLVYVGFFIFVKVGLAKFLKVETIKSESFKVQEIEDAKKELKYLLDQQTEISMQDEFAKYSKLQRQINSKQKIIETLLTKYNNLNIQKRDQRVEQIKKLVSTFLENSFLASIICYILLRNIEIPIDIDPTIFYPMQSILGFEQIDGETIFKFSFLFSYLNVRFCNKIANYFINQLQEFQQIYYLAIRNCK